MFSFRRLTLSLENLATDPFQHPAISPIMLGFILWLIWRLWRFTIIPRLYPTNPKELPYLVPYLGHAVGFFLNSYRVLDKGRKHIQNSREPYSITIAGQLVYVITSPEDVQSLYKHSATLSWLRFVQDLYRWIGISQPNIDKLWKTPTEEQRLAYPMRKLSPNQMVEEYQFHLLLPGEKLDEITKTFVGHLDEKLRWQQLQSGSCVLESSGHLVKVSLLDWTAAVFLQVTTEIYWGKTIWEVAPNLIQSFLKWEETTWKYVFQLPAFLSKDMYAAKDQLVDAFTAYFGQPKERRSDANYFVKTAEEELRDINFDDHNIAKVHMLQHWAVNGNVHKATFWIFAYLAHNPELLDVVRAETAPGVVNDTPDAKYLAEKCPRLEAIFLEVLRLTMSSSLMRYVTEPTVIGGKLLQKGYNVMVPYRQLHFSEGVWGSDAYQFDPERFLKQPKLARSPSFRPFGGGQHMCPGRFLARYAVFTFVALTLSRFDVSLDTPTIADGNNRGLGVYKQRFPRADESKPGLGTLAPVAGDKVILRLKPKAKVDS